MSNRQTTYRNLPDEPIEATPGQVAVTLVSLTIIAVCLAVAAIVGFVAVTR